MQFLYKGLIPPRRAWLTAVLALSTAPGFCATTPYEAAVTADGPAAYYRFNDSLARGNINANVGSLGSAGDLTNTLTLRAFPGAIAGSGDRAQFFDTSGSYGMIPFNAAFNPDNTKPFTLEVWLYPASDQINSGQCPMNNRLATSGADRTGWVIFQRAPNDSYTGMSGYEGVGWNFRMFRGSGSSSGLDLASGVPYEVGKWTHMVVVYDPVDPVANATLTMYIDGVQANTVTWTGGSTGTDPGYVANVAATDVALSLGAYNNKSGAGGNAYFGGIDEFAFYAAKLTPEQILAHYENGTNANRTTPYDTLVKSANPVVYLRLNEPSPVTSALNMGDLRSAGVATHTAGVRYPAASALAGRTDDAAAAYHKRNGTATTTIPFKVENNPDAMVPFTFETWLRPMMDQQGGQCPVNNRWLASGAARTGWVIFQRNPNLTYPAGEGHGWNFRMYNGGNTSGEDVVTDTDYVIGEWSHLVVTWEPYYDMGDPGNGNHQAMGNLTAYFNGVPVATNTGAVYAANRETTETGAAPADLAIGSYNATSGLGNNPFEGDVDEFAIYNNYVLKPEQILAHYMAGTNSHPATNYATQVLMAAYDPTFATPQRTMPKTYLRFNEMAQFPAANSGSLGYLANGNLVLTTNNAAGPVTPGFETANTALALNGTNTWASLNNPPGLNVAGQITLEAWIKPGATQGALARIVSHGPPTLTSFDLAANPGITLTGSLLSSNEVSLRIEGNGTSYSVGSSDGTTFHGATAPIPAGDLGGVNGWIHLAGTYDGANWKLFRNGVQLASVADAVGALPVSGADWAVGSTGNGWADSFAGGIDEVAIYKTALTAAQIQTHYAIGQSGSVKLTIERSGNTYLIRYPAGTLQQADTVSGNYQDVPSASSPYTVPTVDKMKFFRLKL